jgi:outer membrane protein assembly factor BamB
MAPPGTTTGQSTSVPGQSTRPTALIVGAIAVAIVALIAGFLVLGRDDGGGGSSLGSDAPMGKAPTEEPEEEWSERIDCAGGCDLAVTSDGVFLFGYLGGSEVILLGLDRSDGSELWSTSVDGAGEIAAIDDTVIATLDLDDEDDESSSTDVVAFSPDDGDELWRESFEAATILGYRVPGAVVVYNFSDDETSVLDLTDGTERWSERGLAVAQCGGAFVHAGEGEVSLLDTQEGDVRWTVGVSEEGFSGAGCAGDAVVMIDDGELIALSSSDGEELWSERLPEDYGYVAGAKDGQIAVISGDELLAFSAKDGSETWNAEVSISEDEQDDGLFITDRGFLLVIGGKEAILFDAKSGEERASARVGEARGIELAENALVIFDDREIIAYELSSLEERWTYDADDAASIATDEGTLFVQSSEEVSAAG